MPRFRLLSRGPIVLGLLALALACSSAPPGGTGPDGEAKAEPGRDGPLAPEVRAKVCRAEHVDETSKLFLARNKAGVAERIVVTPSRTIPDMGNLVFDMQGELLGHETGSGFPWDDPKLAGEERARLAKLMSGAIVPNTEPPLSCAK